MKKLTDKGKHTVKVGNHPYTRLVGRLKTKIIKSFVSTISSYKRYTKQLDVKYMILKTVIVRGGE